MPPVLSELLQQIRLTRRARSGTPQERVAVALEDIADRLELLAGMVAVMGDHPGLDDPTAGHGAGSQGSDTLGA